MDTNQISELIIALAKDRVGQGANNNSVIIAGIVMAALAPTLASIVVWFKAKAVHGDFVEMKGEVTDLKEHVNSKMDLLLKKSEEVAHAAGAAEQRTTTAIVDKLDNGNKISPSHPVVLAILEEIRKHEAHK